MKYILLIALFCCAIVGAQVVKPEPKDVKMEDTLVVDNGHKDSMKIFKPTIGDYKYRTQFGEERLIDTTFTVQKSYAYTQYNNQDNFGKIQFANVGSGFQDLLFKHNPEQNLTLLPTNKSHFYIGADNIRYYDVKTPTTSFIYHSAMKNGGGLQSRYTQNFGKNFNFAAEYMGLRSQGFYDNNLASNNHTLFSGHYLSKNNRYEFFAHYIHQNVSNEENGGIASLSLFLSGDDRFDSRENLEVNLQSSDSRFSARRYYFSQSFAPFNVEKYPFKIRHTFFHQGNKYYFSLGSDDASDFDDIIDGKGLNSKKYSKNLSNTVSLLFDNAKFKLDAGVRYQNIKLGTDYVLDDVEYNDEWSENRIGAVGNLRINLLEKYSLNSNLEYSTGKTFGNYLRSANRLKFEPIKDYFVDAKINFQSVAPSFNYLMNSSPITSYNYSFSDFKNETILEIGGTVGLKWFDTQLFANYFRMGNLTYITSERQPEQSSESLNVTQIGGDATFSYRKFHFNTRLAFQTMIGNKSVYPAPSFVARGNLFYKTSAFKKAADIMTGIKVYYFSKFDSRDYSPILNEFIMPNSSAYGIGGEPIFDAYFNMKVKTMQFYVEAQNFTTTFMQNKSYTAPYFPIYDFRVNIGIVWNLFH